MQVMLDQLQAEPTLDSNAEFERDGYQSFMSNLCPSRATVLQAYRQCLDALYDPDRRVRARRGGASRKWGVGGPRRPASSRPSPMDG
ncbi:MAG: hypothetical protein ACYC1D_01340 [Acidimicrobiales bacterium]